MRPSTPLCALALLALSAPAQVPVGGSIATVIMGPTTGYTGSEMYMTDPTTGKSTRLPIPAALASELVNSVVMTSQVKGYVGTYGNKDAQGNLLPGGVWSITTVGTSFLATKVNTTALPGQNVAQVAMIGSTLYASSNTISGTTSSVGQIHAIPSGGGAPVLVVDLAQDSNWFSGQLVNSLCSDGVSKLYAGGWGTGMGIYEYDLTARKSRVLCVLPNSRFNTGTYPFYAVNLHVSKLRKNQLVAIGRYGDVAYVDMTTGKIVDHFHSNPGDTIQFYVNAGDERAEHGDVLVGNYQGLGVSIPFGTGGGAERVWQGHGSDAVLTQNYVTGVWYNESSGTYAAYGDGCAGTSLRTATSLDRGGLPIAGNAGFEMALEGGPGGAIAVLMWGASNTWFLGQPLLPLDLTPAGAPSCSLRQDMLLLSATTLSGTGAYDGAASLKVPLPNLKATLYTQWLVLEKTANALGMTFSDARLLQL